MPEWQSQRTTMPGLTRWLVWLVVSLLVAGTVVPLVQQVVASDTLPRWDMAKYGAAGARLAEHLASGNLVAFAAEAYDFGVWPPGFPLLETPVFLVAGSGWTTARLLVLTLFAASLFALGWVATGLDRSAGWALALVAMALMATSPLHQVFATLVMLEVPGTFLLLLAWGAYLRAARTPYHLGLWHLTGAATLGLIFVKYNYGLMWALPLVGAELWRRTGGLGGVLTWGVAMGRRIDPTRPWTLFVGFYLLALLGLRSSGGIDTELFGQQIRATSIGNPAYALVVLMVLRGLWRPKRTARWLRARWWRLDRSARIVVGWTVVPVAVWMLLPPHLKEFFGFVENRDSGLGWVEGLAFYPRALAEHYAPWPWLGWLVPLAAGLGMVCGWGPRGRSGIARVSLGLVLGLGLLALLAHPYKLPRFAMTVMPAVWLAAAHGVVVGASWLGRSSVRGHRWALRGVVLAALVLWAVGAPASRQTALGLLPQHTVPAPTATVVEAVLQASVEVDSGPTVLLGTWNLLSPGLVEWQAIRDGVPAALRPRPARRLGRKARRWLGHAEQVLLLDVAEQPPPPWASAFVGDTQVEAALRHEVLQGPAWVEAGREEFPRAGYRLRVLRRQSPGGR